MSEALAYLDGRILPAADCALSLADAGFVMGATVTDLARTFNGELFRWEAHLRRFRESCRACHILLPATDSELTSAAQEIIANNRVMLPTGGELGVVLFTTPGPIGLYSGADGDGPPTIGLYTFPIVGSRYRHLFTSGARLAIPATLHEFGVPPAAKQRSRMGWWIARQEARRIDAAAEPLLLTREGLITETPSANLIVVLGGRLFTPPANSVLPGVTLDVIRKLRPDVVERRLTVEDCRAADEIILTCTTWCVAGVSAIDGVAIPWPGPVLREIQDCFSEFVEVDFIRQFIQSD
ncbi:MAG: aminotransferase class IV [Gemmataceae bacterium]|nr:aminotransferase class IV [Gemmataceae bacterium]